MTKPYRFPLFLDIIPDEKQRPGLECPECLGPTYVIQTYNHGFCIRRVRQCVDRLCFSTFKTTETRDKEPSCAEASAGRVT